jgi:prevent-host-death family protein
LQLVDQKAMRSVGAFEAKTHLAALLDAVSAGEQITITRHGRPVARLMPPAAEAPASVVDTIIRLRQFSQGQSLGGISIADLRDQDRR